MRPGPILLALALLPVAIPARDPDSRQAPAYSAASIVNLASGRMADLAPNTLAVIYGDQLASTTRSRQDSDLQGVILPYVLSGTGVTVKVNGLLAGIEYVSPDAVVFIVPPELDPGPALIVLTRNALNGPSVLTELKPTAPALIPFENGRPLARAGSNLEWITAARPLAPGDEVILYGTGLGPTIPPQTNRRVASAPAAIQDALRIQLDGADLDPRCLSYAGVSQGVAGIYEIRFTLPPFYQPDPEVRLFIGEQGTQPGLRLYTQPPPPPPRSIQ